MYTCLICQKSFDNSRKYGGHISRHSKEEKDRVGIVHKIYDGNIDFILPVLCKFCGRLCKNKNSVLQHQIRCLKNPNKIQYKGGFLLYNKNKKQYTEKQNFKCKFCGNEYNDPQVLGGHIINCLKNFDNRREEFIKITKNHTGIINVNRKCPRCGNSGDILFRGKYCLSCKKEYYESYIIECKFMFNVYDYPDYFDLGLIEKYGWFSPPNRGNNINGVSRDHIVSVNFGFINKIDPKIIRHPANCKIILQSENSKKYKKSFISYDQLIQKIQLFNTKYNYKDI